MKANLEIVKTKKMQLHRTKKSQRSLAFSSGGNAQKLLETTWQYSRDF